LPGSSTASFSRYIEKAGYFTIRVVDKEETFQGPFNVTVNVLFTKNT